MSRVSLEVPFPDEVAQTVAAGFRDVPDFPQPGVVFKDITPLLADAAALASVTATLAGLARHVGAEAVAGIEARGFMLAAPTAERAGVGFWPVRKAGKLPPPVLRRDYQLEYGTASLELSTQAQYAGRRVLVVDDVLATGGTARAACELLEEAGAVVVGFVVLLELGFLNGRPQLGDRPVLALHTQP
ncbi:adenine phosphoribosyltransferase [Kineococcus sp. SYSU DK003]|uniref:adenine phosphoribosyltransferase n=1 Tax=Kineococcus sp. SYSU DK003 TaxID=3383124 RepID=UPI003D7E60CA